MLRVIEATKVGFSVIYFLLFHHHAAVQKNFTSEMVAMAL